jgi:Zn-dependent M16 (insulinase) family peptidase
VLCGSNEAPLKKALLERGLAEDVEFAPMDGIQQQMVLLVVRNTKAEQREQVWQVVRETLQQQVEQGLDHKQLRAVLNHFEYSTREKEFSSMPAGLVYAMSSMESWLYGGDPAQNLCHDEVFRTLREGIDQGCFEQFLREALLENPHHATVCMIPSKTVGAENRQKEKARLAQIKAGLSEGQCCQMAAEFDAFRERQSAPDTAEQLATLPMLSLSDIQEDSRPIRQEEQVRGGVTVLHHPLETDGILHLELYFSVADLPQEQMPLLSFFAKLLGEAATEHYSVTELSSEIDDKLGRFFVVPTVFSKVDQRDSAEPYLVVRLSMLESQKEEAVRLLDEVLNRSSFADQNFLLHFLRQNRMSLEQSVTMSGNSFAAMRVGGSLSPRGALSEAMQGIQYLRWLQETERSLESDGQALSQALAGLLQTCFLRQRVTVNVTGPLDEAWVDRVLAVLPEGNMGAPATYHSLPLRREGFLIPAEIGFAGKVGWVDDLRAANVGAAQVAAQLLTYDYLWNTIRVQGGAYGTSLGLRQEGEAVFTTYRDPSPAQSLVTFDQSGQALRDFCASEDTVERYIISTIAAGDPLMSPRLEGTFGARCYFTGLTLEERQRVRSAVLHTTKEQLASFSHQLDEACAHAGVCVIGGKHVIEECGQTLDTVSSVQ